MSQVSFVVDASLVWKYLVWDWCPELAVWKGGEDEEMPQDGRIIIISFSLQRKARHWSRPWEGKKRKVSTIRTNREGRPALLTHHGNGINRIVSQHHTRHLQKSLSSVSFAAGEMVFLSHPLLTTRLLSGPVILRCQDPCLGCRDSLEVQSYFTQHPSRAEPLTLSTKKERERRGELFRRPPRLPPRTCPRPRSGYSILLEVDVSTINMH